MKEELKTALLEAAEETTKTVLNQAVKIGEAAVVAHPEKKWLPSVVSGAALLKVGFLEGLAEMINPAD